MTVDEVQSILDRIDIRFPLGSKWILIATDVGQRVVIKGYANSMNSKSYADWWPMETREYVIDPASDEASVVRTVWAMVQTAYVHEASEFFKLDGVAVMGPHMYGNGPAKP